MRIGIMTQWGFGRGTVNWAKCYIDMLDEVFILKQRNNLIEPEYLNEKLKITETPDWHVNPEIFKNWVADNKLELVIFNEYGQWGTEPNDLPKIAKELGAKTAGMLIMERFFPEQNVFDFLIAPVHSIERFYRRQKIRNFIYIPFSIDISRYPKETPKKNEIFTFFHPGGFGGVMNRKNTEAVLKAYEKFRINNPNTKLVITSQKGDVKCNIEGVEIINRHLPFEEMIDLYRRSNCVLLPTKFESINQGLIEAGVCYTPSITTDTPPNNEIIIDKRNGFTCLCHDEASKDIAVPIANVDVDDLVKKMELIMNPMFYDILVRNSRKVVEELYDIKKNKVYMDEFLETVKQ